MTLGRLDEATSLPRKVGAIPAVRTWWAYRNTDDPTDWALRSSVCRYIYDGPVARNDEPPAPNDFYKSGRINADPLDDRGFYTFRADPEVAYVRIDKWLDDMANHLGGVVSKRCPRVVGRVSIFGDVCVHQHGYRSEALTIDRLWIIRWDIVETDWGSCKAGLEKRYRCPVEFHTDSISASEMPTLAES